MKRILAILSLSVVLLLCTNACTKTKYDLTGTIAGTVVDFSTGAPMNRTLITLSPSQQNTYSGTEGHFEFIDIEPGRYTVAVTKEGYHADRKVVVVVAGQKQDVFVAMEKDD